MQDLSNINTIKEILSAHGFTFSKSLGQNFLINPTVCPRMAEACGADENTGVIEIGAGVDAWIDLPKERCGKVEVGDSIEVKVETGLFGVRICSLTE